MHIARMVVLHNEACVPSRCVCAFDQIRLIKMIQLKRGLVQRIALRLSRGRDPLLLTRSK
jgi:hypothetical protein